MRVFRDGFNQLTTYENAEDLIRRVEAPCALADNLRSSVKGSRDFTSTESLSEAVSLARKGWADGLEIVRTMRADVTTRLNGITPVPQVQFGVRGTKVNMGKFMAGNPKPMMTLVDSDVTVQSLQPKILTLTCNIAASAAVSQATLLRRGAAMIVLVDVLQRRRIRCNIDLVMVSQTRVSGDCDRLEYRLRVKHAGEPISMDKLAFFLGHDSSLRRLMLAIMEHEPDDIRKHYGIGRDMHGEYGIPGTTDNVGDIYLDRILAPTDWSDGITMAWLGKALASQGITLKNKE